MLKQNLNALKISLFFLIGLLTLITPTVSFASGDSSGPGLRTTDYRNTTVDKDDDREVDEPPPDPFAPKPGRCDCDKDDDREVDEPPPDPRIPGAGLYKNLRGKSIFCLLFCY